VVVVSRGGDLPSVADVTLFRLAVSPGGRPGGLGELNFDSRGVPVTGAALSPGGRMLALSLVQGFPSWANGGMVIVPWWHSASQGMIPAGLTGIRQLDAVAPGGSLAAAPLVAFPAPVLGLQSAMIAPSGGEVIASSCRARHHTATARVIELSAADGRLVRVLRAQTARFASDADAQDAIASTCQVLSVAGDGDHVLVRAFTFGRIDNGAFASLPGTTPRILPVSATW
jgi:hypothetical protein